MTAPHTHVYRWKTLNGARFSHGAHRTHPLDIETLVFPPLKIFFYLLIAGVCLGQYFIREYSGLREGGPSLFTGAPFVTIGLIFSLLLLPVATETLAPVAFLSAMIYNTQTNVVGQSIAGAKRVQENSFSFSDYKIPSG